MDLSSELPDLPDPRIANDSAQAWGEADARLKALLTSGISPARALLQWGPDLLRAGRADDAVLVFRTAAALAPQSAVAWTHLGIALERAGASSGIIACFQRSLALAPLQPDTWLLLGMRREKQGDLVRAEEDYRAALRLEPTSSVAWKCLGALLYGKGDAPGAIHAFSACLEHGPPDAAVSASLGRGLYEEGRLAESHAAYTAALAGAPDSAHYETMVRRTQFLCDLVDGESVDRALENLASRGPSPRRPSGHELSELFETASAALTGFGHREAAYRLATRRVDLWPESAAARYLLASLQGDPTLVRSPAEYIVENFDAFAHEFEAQLVGVLGYDVPEQICKLLGEVAAGAHFADTLDAGCGTGLCGPLLRPRTDRLVGVDLSSKMLEHARARGVYDTLVCEELTTFLGRGEGQFDLIVAADVLIYFGALRPLFSAAATALRPGGLLTVSTERSESGDYSLGPSGRFAHSSRHVHAAARDGFETVVERQTTLRREMRERVGGHVFVFRRRERLLT